MGFYKQNKDSIDLGAMLVAFIFLIFISSQLRTDRLSNIEVNTISFTSSAPMSTEMREWLAKQKMDSIAIDLIKRSEGFNSNWKRCPKGIKTIGYGFTKMKWNSKMTKPEADSILNLKYFRLQENIKKSIGSTKLKDNQLAALTVFSYNVGFTAFTTSKIFRYVKVDKFHLVGKELKKWVYIKKDGEVILMKGLIKRREKESKLWKLELS